MLLTSQDWAGSLREGNKHMGTTVAPVTCLESFRAMVAAWGPDRAWRPR